MRENFHKYTLKEGMVIFKNDWIVWHDPINFCGGARQIHHIERKQNNSTWIYFSCPLPRSHIWVETLLAYIQKGQCEILSDKQYRIKQKLDRI